MNLYNKDILDEFQLMTGKNLREFFSKALLFFTSDYPAIVEYFSGKRKDISSLPFENFTFIKQELDSCFTLFQLFSNNMKDSRWWILLDQLEEIDSRLLTLASINRWARSSATSTSYSPTVQIDYVLLQNETLETVSKNVLGDANPQDDWVNIALSNDLEEEDYSFEGGNPLRLQLDSLVNLGITVNSVVDTIIGKSIYGRDLTKYISFENDDLTSLQYDDTIKQAADILSKLRKGDNPNFPNLGIQSTAVIGANRNLMNFPIISRQMNEVFNSDDTFKNFQMVNLSISEDNLTCAIKVTTRLNEVESYNLVL